jgi:hypothetical protein
MYESTTKLRTFPNDIELLRYFGPSSFNGTFGSSLIYSQLGLGNWPSHFQFIACTICQILVYQKHAAVDKTAKIPGNISNATSCPHNKNELMLLSDYKNVTVYYLLIACT